MPETDSEDIRATLAPGLIAFLDLSLAILALVLANSIFADEIVRPDDLELAASTDTTRATAAEDLERVLLLLDATGELSGPQFRDGRHPDPVELLRSQGVQNEGVLVVVAADRRAPFESVLATFDRLEGAGYTARIGVQEPTSDE